MHPINGKGFAVGAVLWLFYIVLTSHEASCAEFRDCGSGDLILASIIAVGGLFPAWVLASLVSGVFPDKTKR